MRTRRLISSILEAVKKAIESADTRSFVSGKAAEQSEARTAAQVLSEKCDGFRAQESKKQQGPQDSDGMKGRPTSGRGRIKRSQEGMKGIQIET